MPDKRKIFRDHRPGKKKGQFVSEETYKKSKANDGEEIIAEKVKVSKAVVEIDDVDDLFDYEDYPDLEEFDFHGTGDTGKKE